MWPGVSRKVMISPEGSVTMNERMSGEAVLV